MGVDVDRRERCARTRLMRVAHVKDVARVDVVIERLLNQLLRLIAGQLRYSARTHTHTHTHTHTVNIISVIVECQL